VYERWTDQKKNQIKYNRVEISHSSVFYILTDSIFINLVLVTLYYDWT